MNTIRNIKRLKRRERSICCPLSAIRYPLSGFTLVELLTVIVIISMLAAISLIALNGSYKEAKIAKTRSTIAKLDAAIQQIFEEYEEKFDAISIDQTRLASALGISVNNVTSNHVALAKLHFIRDLMRMEMPQKWDEVNHNSGGPIPIGLGANAYAVDVPAVLAYYQQAFLRYSGTPDLYESPALLYLIIANLNPEALENFHGSEIGTDIDGFQVFVDAWGTPIRFVRWAPAFPDSDKQPNVLAGVTFNLNGNSTLWPGVLTANLNGAGASTSVPDPFDNREPSAGGGLAPTGWFLYPLIISAGPDRIFDIDTTTAVLPNDVNLSTTGIYNPFSEPTASPPVATGIPDNRLNPYDGSSVNSVLNHYDNIHNHRSAGGF